MINNRQEIPREYDFTRNTRNPYGKVRMSLVLPARNSHEEFVRMIQSLVKTCSDPDAVEFLVKFDSDVDTRPHVEGLMDCGFRFKVLSYPRYHGYFDQHLFLNDLCKLANGDLIWSIGDDMEIVQGDWLKGFLATRDKYFKDNVYCLHVGQYPARPTGNPFPLLTKEWIKFFGCFSPVSNVDSFTHQLAHMIGRYLKVDGLEIHINHKVHGYMLNDKSSPLTKKKEWTTKMAKEFADKWEKRKCSTS